jgi:hypothetical protein
MYAKIENNSIVEWPIVNLFKRLPQVSFPREIDNNNLPEGFVFIEPAVLPEYDVNSQAISLSYPFFKDNKWVQEYVVNELNTEELQKRKENLAVEIRSERDQRLLQSDWTQIPDVPVDKQAWGVYRQALRDITLQEGFPYSIVWPTPPG